jgi:DNA-directed RNA polymerase specialized sigma24 family protein
MPRALTDRLERSCRTTSPQRLRDASTDILRRAQFLDPRDKLLIDLAVRNRLSVRQLGRVFGLPTGTICRRMKRLANRLLNPVVIALLERNLPLPNHYRQLGVEYFLQGRSFTELADLHRIPRATVQRMISHVRGWHEGLSTRFK